jgi:hypothetical protein
MTGLVALSEYLDTRVLPFASLLSKKPSCYQHLEYTGCASIGITGISVEEVFRRSYPGVFSKGFQQSDIKDALPDVEDIPQTLFTSCLHDSSRLQFDAADEETLDRKLASAGLSETDQVSLRSLHTQHLLDTSEIKEYLLRTRPAMEHLFDVWNASFLKSMTLTSVGMAIAHANSRRVTEQEVELSIWV